MAVKNKNNSFRGRLIFGNLCIVGAVIVLLFGAFFVYYYTAQRDYNSRQLTTVANTAVINIQSSLGVADSIALQLSTNGYISDQMEAIWQSENNLLVSDVWLTKEVNTFIWSYLLRKDNASRICIYNAEGSFISVGSSVDSAMVDIYTASAKLTSAKQNLANGENVQYLLYANDPLSELGGGYISIMREVRDPLAIGTSKAVGYVEVQVPLNAIEKHLAQLEQEQFQLALYSNSDNQFLIGNEQALFDDELNVYIYDDINLETGKYVQTNQNGYSIALNFENEQLVLVAFDTGEMLNEQIMLVLFGVAVLLLAILILLYLVQKRFVLHITKPLFALFDEVKTRGFDHAKTSPIPASSDELEDLQNSFNSMLIELQNSSEMLNGAQIGQLRAQLLALQAQTDPHFIHNTLSVMVALSQEGNNEMVEQVALRLSEMIRYSTSFEKTFCTMEQEIRHLENYLELIAVRYEQNFEYEIINNVENQQFYIPRFITQPIAENALAYSLKMADYPWKITVECESDEYYWRIIISDNGVGITKEKAAEVMKQIYITIKQGVDSLVDELKIGGLSLLNINARLFLNYKEDMIFCITPNESGGTKVIIGGKVNAD